MKRPFAQVWAEHQAAGACIECGQPGFPCCDRCNANDGPLGPEQSDTGYDPGTTRQISYHRNLAGEHVLNGHVERHPGAE